MLEFSASECEVRKSKYAVTKTRVLTFPEAKQGRKLTEETENLISNFYEDNENNRSMPDSIRNLTRMNEDLIFKFHTGETKILCFS